MQLLERALGRQLAGQAVKRTQKRSPDGIACDAEHYSSGACTEPLARPQAWRSAASAQKVISGGIT